MRSLTEQINKLEEAEAEEKTWEENCKRKSKQRAARWSQSWQLKLRLPKRIQDQMSRWQLAAGSLQPAESRGSTLEEQVA